MEAKFVSTTREDCNARTVVEAKFVSIKREDHFVRTAVGVKFVSTTRECSTCDPLGHLAGVVRGRVYIALKNDKEMSSTEYLGCNMELFNEHIEQQFTEGMSWENYDEWHIDHKIPLKYNKSSLEEVAQWQY